MLINTWRFVTILLVALLLGLAFAHVLERPAKMLYDAAFYLTIQKTLYVAWGPPNIGGILEPAAIFATLLLALLLAFPVVFFVFVAPANEVFLAATPTSIPPNWIESRASWETGHAIRFVFQLVALSLLLLSVFLEVNEISAQRREFT
jgi:hypothetical protein